MSSKTLSFIVNGKSFTTSAADVAKAVSGVVPGAMRTHGVKVNGTVYPVKQVIALITGLDPLDFQSAQARSILTRLGMECGRWRSG